MRFSLLPLFTKARTDVSLSFSLMCSFSGLLYALSLPLPLTSNERLTNLFELQAETVWRTGVVHLALFVGSLSTSLSSVTADASYFLPS